MNSKTKYYIRRIVTMFLIASPCYIWSQTLVLVAVIGVFSILPEGDYLNDVEGWVMGLQLLTWIVMFVIGWFGSKLLIVKPKEIAKPIEVQTKSENGQL